MRRHLALAAAVVLGPLSAFGQSKEEASRLFFKGDILARQAEQYAGAGREAQARQAYENALAQFQVLTTEYPDYSPAAVERRLKDTRARLQALGGGGSAESANTPKATRLTGQGGSTEKPVAQQLASPTSGATSPRGSGPMLASTGRSSAGSGGGASEQDPMALLRAATPMATKASPSPDSAGSPRETGPSFQGTAPERPVGTVRTPPPPKARGTAVGAESVAVEGQLQKSLQEIDQLTKQLNQAESRLTAESGRNTDLENQMKSLREQIAASQKAIEEGKNNARKLESMEDKLKQMELVARKQVELKDSEIATQKENAERLKRELAAANQREEEAMEEKLRERLTKLAEERVELMQRNDELTEQLRGASGELAKYRDAAKSDLPTVRLQELQARIEAQTKEQQGTLEKLKALQTELKSAHDDAQTLREQLAAADTGQRPAAANGEELTEYKRRSEQAAKDKLESLQEIARLRGEVAKASEAVAAAQKERDAAVAGGASDDDTAAELATIRKTLAEAQQQRDHLAQRVAEFQAKEKKQEEAAAELQALLAEARQREDNAQVELKKSLAAAKNAEAPLKTKLGELEKSQLETLNALNTERQQIAKLETELDLLKKENSNLKVTVDRQKGTPESDQRIAELTETLETVRRESAKLQEERQELQNSKTLADRDFTEKLAAKDEELAKASKSLAALQSENKNLQSGQGAELAALTKQKSEIEKALTSSRKDAERNEGLLKEVQAKLAAAENEKTSLETELAALKKSGKSANLARTDDKAPKQESPKAENTAVVEDSSDDLLAEAMKLADSAADTQTARQEQLARQAAEEVDKLRKATAAVDETPKNKPLPGPNEQPAETTAKKGVEAPKDSGSGEALVSLDTNAYELPLPGELPTAQALSASRNMGAIARGEAFDASLEAAATPTASPLVGSRSSNPAGLPDDMADLAREAKRYFEGRQYPQAEKAFEKIVEKEPENVFAMSNLGVVRFRMKKYKEAEEILQRAVKVDAEDAFSWETLGIVYYSQNRIDEAIEVLSRSISIDSQSATAHNFLGIASSKKGWPEAAEDELRKAITLNPNYADAHFNLAVLYATSATPSNALARQHYQRATSLGAAPNPSLESMIKGN